MPDKKSLPVIKMVRRLYRFDTELEMANLVSSIDRDADLRKALMNREDEQNYFYRLSLQYGPAFYCIIFHSFSLAAEHQQAIVRHATKNGGVAVTDEKIKNTLSTYATIKWTRKPGHVRWDSPPPKVN